MRKLLLMLLLLMQSYLSDAQKIRFTDTSNVWQLLNQNVLDIFWSPVKSSITGTTIHNGIIYSIYHSNYDSVLVRFDSASNIVYAKVYYNKYYGADTTEFTLYNFSLNIGDSLKTPHFSYVVSAKDSLYINGTKHYTFEIQTNFNTIKILEGIGSIQDPLMPYFGFFFEERQKLTCFQQNGSFPVLSSTYNGFDNSISCKDTNGLDVKKMPINKKEVNISPNPANQFSKITFSNTIQSGSLIITDVLGKTVYSKQIVNKTEIAIGEIPACGIYFYTIFNNFNNEYYKGKFMYE